MVDRLPLMYHHQTAAHTQARREAERITSLKVLMELGKQREHEETLMEMRRQQLLASVDPLSYASVQATIKQRQQAQAAQFPLRQPVLAPTISDAAKIESLLLSNRRTVEASLRRESLLAHHRYPPPVASGLSQGDSSSPKLTAVELAASVQAVAQAAAKQEGQTSRANETVTAALKRTASPNDVKVKAALQSQHQRGRKRSELSAQERQELTKTRNREHARNTRLRKKARHNQLVDAERRLKPLLQSKLLVEERLKCLHRFLSTREKMLNATGSLDPQRESKLLLNEIHSDPKLFHFEQKGMPDCLSDKESSELFLSKMRVFDQYLFRALGSGRIPLLSKQEPSSTASTNPRESPAVFAYEIVDGLDGIAISSNGTSYFRVELVVYQTSATTPLTNTTTTSNHRTVVATILFQGTFWKDDETVQHVSKAIDCTLEEFKCPPPPSPKLFSVVWTLLEDHCGCFQKQECNFTKPTPEAPLSLEALVVAAASKAEIVVSRELVI